MMGEMRQTASPRGAAWWFALSLAVCWGVTQLNSQSVFAQNKSPVATQDPMQAMNHANGLVRDGKFGEAIDIYSKLNADSIAETAKYNAAIAHYRSGEIEAAISLFQQTAGSTDQRIAANSQFNLGQCRHTQGIAAKEQDKETARQRLNEAIDLYRNALRSDPDRADARANIELAVRLLQDLKQDQQKQDQQKQDQQKQDQQKQDQQKQDQQKQDQQKQDQQKQDQQKQDQQKQDQQKQDQQKQDQQKQDQQKQDQQKQDQQKQDQQKQDQQKQDQQKQDQQKQDQQKQDQQKQDSGADETAAPDPKSDQEPAEGKLTAANEDETASEVDQEKRSDSPERMMTRQEALKMLQAVRDQDMLRRLRQQQRERARRIPVEMDW